MAARRNTRRRSIIRRFPVDADAFPLPTQLEHGLFKIITVPLVEFVLNPVYGVRRLGIDFVASPRHADGVVVTGPVTRNLETAGRRSVEAIPEPRVVIAVGACAASGGIVGEGYASAGGVDRVLPVDTYIPGCPPRPEAIIFGILVAIGRLDARRPPREG